MGTKAAPTGVNIIQTREMDRDNIMEMGEDTSPQELFEGDIIVSREVIMELYNFSSISGGEELLKKWKRDSNRQNWFAHRVKHAAGRPGISINSWTNNVVPYKFNSSISEATAQIVRDGMDHWEDNTCLRFLVKQQNTSDYVEVINHKSGCFSHVGRINGRQEINLEANTGCEDFGVVVHEIGHAVGFWHEQSRPDRDNYVNIHTENIQSYYVIAFMKKKNYQIDSLGSAYDFGSIMHYSTTAFKKPGCFGQRCITISISNQVEYNRQGRPALGQRNSLSTRDIAQANALYNCQNTGVRGFLLYRAKYGHNLRDTDGAWFGDPDPYIEFTSIDLNKNRIKQRSSDKPETRNPIWNEWVPVREREWNSFRVRVWDDDSFPGFPAYGDDSMSVSETFLVEPGHHYNLKHCNSPACSGYILFDYHLLTLVPGKFQFYIRYTHNLYTDNQTLNDTGPDPYIRIQVTQANGEIVTMNSASKGGTLYPNWNESINFDCRKWAFFEIQLLDNNLNTGADNTISSKELVFLQSGHHSQRHNASENGYLVYDYSFVVNGNECDPNPCQNGGTCINECSNSQQCSCPLGYNGTYCEHPATVASTREGNLTMYACIVLGTCT